MNQKMAAKKNDEIAEPVDALQLDAPTETTEQQSAPKVELTVLESGMDAGVESSQANSVVQTARFAPLGPGASRQSQGSMDLLLDVDLDLSVELGRASLPVRDILQLGPGSIVELEKLAGEPVDIMVNGKLIAKGEVVVVDESFGVRVTEISSQSERLSKLS